MDAEDIEMGLSLLSIPLLVTLGLSANPQPPTALPMLSSVDPPSGKVGDVLTVQGVNLGTDCVAAVYLTNGNVDLKVVITLQTSTTIKFKIPPHAGPGRFALMLLTSEIEPKLIEQPVKITVEPDTTE